MPKSIVIAPTVETDLQVIPVMPDGLLNGTPLTRSKQLARSHDRTSQVVVWDRTAGGFTWHYTQDETLVVLDGEAFITNEKGEERRIGADDVVFFPAGTSSRWYVPRYIKKVAFLRQSMPRPIALGMLVWSRLLRIGRLRGRIPWALAILANPIVT